ncbi:hypothetical protein ACHAWF_002896 [Thalassiosira exigua]
MWTKRQMPAQFPSLTKTRSLYIMNKTAHLSSLVCETLMDGTTSLWYNTEDSGNHANPLKRLRASNFKPTACTSYHPRNRS